MVFVQIALFCTAGVLGNCAMFVYRLSVCAFRLNEHYLFVT